MVTHLTLSPLYRCHCICPTLYPFQTNKIQFHHIFEIKSLLQIFVKCSLLASSVKSNAPWRLGSEGCDVLTESVSGGQDSQERVTGKRPFVYIRLIR